MSMAASSSSSWKYDVFLNFRGEDTRKIFIGHLYGALDRKAINTFIDAEKLRKGNDLSELLSAIEESRLSIVVFSQNYASSTWCLKELVKILACMDAKKQIVVPIFYQVDPSEVRKQKKSFAEAFAQHERESNADMEEVESWRSALTRAANLAGWDSRRYEDDAKLIEEIVDDIFTRLIQVSSSKDNGLVGMDYHRYEVNSRLRPGVNDVFTVGIWGMGGIGKTTIARAVYDEIACQFEACCFLENVKEGFSNNGAVHMQEVLLSRILKEKVQCLGTLDRGSRVIMERLQRKKVFIVLDDVDKLSQIETLLGKQHSFGGGSRVIITTRDIQLLSGAGAVYKPENLSEPEALKLFKQYAFRTNQPTRVYDQLSRHVVQYAQGLPLALKVLGAFLHNKTVREWEDVLEKIRKIPPTGIHDVLKTSFDGLDDAEKDIFLDIACFLKGMKKDYATAILDGCGFYPHTGIGVLIDRALIFVSDKGELEMHDLLEEMGREFVRQESKEPGRRSRLWSYEDVHHVLIQNTATDAVETIILDSAILKEGCSNTEAFVSMTKLRLLMIRDDADIYTKHFCRYRLAVKHSFGHQTPSDCFIEHWIADLRFQSSQLRCLLWCGCPLKSWPSNVQFKNLVNLDMSNSWIEQLWKGAEPLEKLKFINLSHCQYLKKTPDFTKATSLEELNFAGCTRLYEVDPSISALKNLAILNLSRCNDLKTLPSIIGMKSLKTILLSGCSNLEKFPEILEVMEQLAEVYLDFTAIKELPSSISNLTGLTILSLRGCGQLKSLPSSIHMGSLQTLTLSGCSMLEKFPDISDVNEKLSKLYLAGTAIKELPSSINKLTGLTVLDLYGCQELKSLPSSIHMRSLRNLRLTSCSNLEMFPEISDVMEELSELYLDGTAIKELPSSINKLTGLTTLDLSGCQELKSLPSSIHMESLRTLELSGCSNLEMFPETSDVMDELSKLYLDGTAIKELPSSINKLTGLTVLNLSGCQELKSLPSSIHMRSLRNLRLTSCSNLEMFPEISDVMEELSELYLDGTAIKELPSSINKLTGLTVLYLYGCQELKSLPSSIHMGSLQTLNLSGCSNLEMFPDISDVMEELSELYLAGTAIKELPSSINKLTGLTVLDLYGCQELKSLPSSIHMRSLRTLRLTSCSNLEMFPEISDVMEELSELYLDGTAIKELPSSINKLTGLSTLDLSGCQELKSLPSSIHMGSLRTLKLSGCSNLEMFSETSDVMDELSKLYLDGTAIKELPSSINKLTGLTVLNLSGCQELKSLPSSIHMRSLQTLNLSGCSMLEKFPNISDVNEKLRKLYLAGTAIKELPSSINKLTGLTVLYLYGCQELKSLPSSIHMGSLQTLNLSGCSNLEMFPEISDVMEELSELYLDGTAIKELPSSINKLTGLAILDLSWCQELKSLPSSIHMRSLQTLNLSGCSNLEMFREISEVMEKLRELHLDGTAIKELSSSINKFTGLTILNLSWCQELKTLPSSIHMGSLRTLELSGCSNLEMFPEISDVMEKLSKLYLDGTAIKELPSSINKLTGLTVLDLSGCKELKSLPSSIHMRSLQTLNLSGCSNLEMFPEISDVMEELSKLYLDGTAIKELPPSINKLSGLRILDLKGCRELKSLPSSIHMRSLQTLDLSGCSNLEMFPEISEVMEKLTNLHLDGTAIKELPSSINKFTGLTILDLRDHRELKSLPSSIHMRSLRTLHLSGCSNLEKFPEISDVMEKLSKLYLDGTAIKELPSSIRNLPRLVSLNLRNCKSLGCLPDDICNLVSLTVLTLSGCSKLQNLPEKLGNLESLCDLGVEGSGIKQLPLSLLRLNKLTSLSCHGCKEMTAPFSSWSKSMEDCSHRGLVHLDLSDCNLLELSGIAHLSSLKTLDLCRNNFESLPTEMNRLHRLTVLKLEGCKRLKSIPEISSSISFIDAHDCTALESVSRPQLPYRNLYFTFSNCFQLMQNLFEEIVEAHQGNLQPLSLFMYLPGSKLSDWFSHHCSGSSVTVPLPPVSDHEILGFAVCGVTKFKYAHYTSHLSAPCFCTFKGEHGERSFRFDLLDWSITRGRLLESDHMFMGYIQWKNGVQLSERYTEATFRVELNDGQQSRYSGPPVEQHRIRRCGVRLFYANPEEVHNRSMTQPDFHHENSEAEIRAINKSLLRVVHIKKNGEGCCYNDAEQSGGDTPDTEDFYPKRLVLRDGAKEN